MTLNTPFGMCRLVSKSYDTGRMALILESPGGERIATLTVHLPDDPLGPGEFHVKTWAENGSIARAALASGLFADTGKRVPTGFVEAQVWRFAEDDNNA